jgi:hypothetical protein
VRKKGPSRRPSIKPNLSLQIGPKKQNTQNKDNTMRAITSFRNKEMRLLRAFELCEVPKSTRKDTVNNKVENIEKLVNIPGSRKPVLSEVDFRCFFFS